MDPSSLRRAFAGFVLVMGALVLAREGAIVAESARAALPETLPQLVLVLVMLGVGVLLGRATRPPRPPSRDDLVYYGGDGI